MCRACAASTHWEAVPYTAPQPCTSWDTPRNVFCPNASHPVHWRVGTPAAESGVVALPAMASDQAAEAALSCLRSALVRCGGCRRGDQLLSLLQRMTAVIVLPSGRACEEASCPCSRPSFSPTSPLTAFAAYLIERAEGGCCKLCVVVTGTAHLQSVHSGWSRLLPATGSPAVLQ